MDPASVNTFLDQFLGVLDAGFGLIAGDVSFVLNALIVISVTLAGAQWALGGEAPVAPFFRKVLFVGLFAFLVNNWQFLSTAINQSGAMLGLQAGGGRMSLADLHNPGRIAGIGVELFGRTVALGEGMTLMTDFLTLTTILLAALCVMLGFFMLALQLFVALIAFKLGSLAAFVALPWGVFSGTAWVAERPLGWVAASAIRLFVLALIASVSMAFTMSLPVTFTLEGGGALNVLLFGVTVMALAWFGPQLAGEVMSGQPHLSGSDGVRAAQGVAASVAGTAVAGRLIASGMTSGMTNGPGGARSAGARSRRSAAGPGAGTGSGSGTGGRAAIDHGRMQPRVRGGQPPAPGDGGSTP